MQIVSKWEYSETSVSASSREPADQAKRVQHMNELGAKGWELVNSFPDMNSKAGAASFIKTYYFWKRPTALA